MYYIRAIAKRLLFLSFFTFACCVIVFKLPELHDNYIRYFVGSKVVYITNEAGNSGGTGFHIKAPSGKVYILTNAHVCGLAQDGQLFIHAEDDSRPIPRKVIEVSGFTDLCLVEPLPGYSGLTLGSEPHAGQDIEIVGHPQLYSLTKTKGQIIDERFIRVLDPENEKCDLPKNKKVTISTFFGDFDDVCIVEIKAYSSNAASLPGASGSPVVDFYGHVVAVNFAGNQANWGFFVTFKDVVTFLSTY